MPLKNPRRPLGKPREEDDRGRSFYNFLDILTIGLSTRTTAKEMCHDHHQLAEDRPGFLMDICAQAVEVSSLQESMKRKTAILCEVKMRYTAGEIDRFASRSQQLLSSKIVDRKAHMVQHLILKTFPTKV